MEILLSDIFDPRAIALSLESPSKEAAFAELTGALAALRPGLDAAEALAAIVERENKMSTGIAPGVAVPHAFCKWPGSAIAGSAAGSSGTGDGSASTGNASTGSASAAGIIGAIGISRKGIEYDALDGKPVHAVFLLLISEKARGSHLHALNQICALAQSEALARIRSAKEPQDVMDILSRFH